MLENLASHPESDSEALYRSVAGALQHDPGEPELQACWQEALRTYRSTTFAELFDPRQHEQAVSDYKTHRSATPETIPALVEHYQSQMRLYAEAATRLWPEREIKPCLLFTACGTLAAVN